MLYGKKFDKAALAITSIMLILLILFINAESFGLIPTVRTMGYENRLFDKSKVHFIDIVMDDWENFISSAENEEYSQASLIIDGERFSNVAIRAKGNTSLSMVSSLNSSRYSFKVEFDHYDSSLTYYGLDKLSLNNLICDSTMMKDYLCYCLMNEFGVISPLCSYVVISINGEEWGLYLAVEGVEEAFLQRNFGNDYGNLYKPDSTTLGGGRGNGNKFDMKDFSFEQPIQNDYLINEMPNGNESDIIDTPPDNLGVLPNNMPNGKENFGIEMESGFKKESTENFPKEDSFDNNFAIGSDDVALRYIDDNIESYSNIWDNAKTDITTSDKTRLIQSLKKLSEMEDIESVVSVDDVIKYFVVHNFVCNDDSYTGSMIHNYYLYEKDSQMIMIPWDYNLSFGTFASSNATTVVNAPIDDPVTGEIADRPMINWIFESKEYTEIYHRYFSEFLNGIDIEKIIDEAYNLIKPYVQNDPTKFYTYEEFEKGVTTLKEFCSLRSQSIQMQLSENNTEVFTNYADAGELNLSDMGTMNNTNSFDNEINAPTDIKQNFGNDFEMNFEEKPNGNSEMQLPTMPELDTQSPQMPENPPNISDNPMQGNMPTAANRDNNVDFESKPDIVQNNKTAPSENQNRGNILILLCLCVVALIFGIWFVKK